MAGLECLSFLLARAALACVTIGGSGASEDSRLGSLWLPRAVEETWFHRESANLLGPLVNLSWPSAESPESSPRGIVPSPPSLARQLSPTRRRPAGSTPDAWLEHRRR